MADVDTKEIRSYNTRRIKGKTQILNMNLFNAFSPPGKRACTS
ncbi:MAG: hypothetical protein ABIN93_11160 [Ginsengibacter sp.]